jgi:hypothetical protein
VARKVQTESAVKQEFQQNYQQYHARAVQRYPWLAKPTSPENVRMQEMLKVMPQLKQFPDYELVLGDYFRGHGLRLAEEKARGKAPVAAKPAASREPVKVPIGGSPSGAAEKDKSAEVNEAEEQFGKTGKTSDLAKSFSAKARASRAKK